MNSKQFTFSAYCPLCSERITASGRVSEVIHQAKEKHLREEHESDEMLAYYLSRQIADADR